MITKKQIVDKMTERDFALMSYSYNDKKEIISASFASTPTKDIPSIVCDVYLKTEEFELIYPIGYTANVLRTGSKCGSVMNDEHFDGICSQFESQARMLHKYFG